MTGHEREVAQYGPPEWAAMYSEPVLVEVPDARFSWAVPQ